MEHYDGVTVIGHGWIRIAKQCRMSSQQFIQVADKIASQIEKANFGSDQIHMFSLMDDIDEGEVAFEIDEESARYNFKAWSQFYLAIQPFIEDALFCFEEIPGQPEHRVWKDNYSKGSWATAKGEIVFQPWEDMKFNLPDVGLNVKL